MFLYADEAKLFSNNAFSLQQGLDKFTNWLKLHQLDLAVAKCEHLCISRSHCSNSVFAGSLNIKTVSVVKDLGVYIIDNLKWSYHISHIHRHASLCSYQILRSFSPKNIWILPKAFNTYVRPNVEFNTCVWSPYLKKDIVPLESVQRNFTRYAFIRCNIPFNSYNDRLCKLGIKSLEYRRDADSNSTSYLCSKFVITFVICNFPIILSIVTASIICVNMIHCANHS